MANKCPSEKCECCGLEISTEYGLYNDKHDLYCCEGCAIELENNSPTESESEIAKFMSKLLSSVFTWYLCKIIIIIYR